MRKLNKAEIRFLNYLDANLENLDNKSPDSKAAVFDLLKNELGLSSREVSHVYSLWYYYKGEGDYSEIEVEEDVNQLVAFIKLMQSLETDSDRDELLDEMWDNDRNKLQSIYGRWFNVNYTDNPSIIWKDDHIVLELDVNDWETYFSGLDEDSYWQYHQAYSSYTDYYDELDTDEEFKYLSINEETIELLEEIATLAGRPEWPGKDGKSVDHDEIYVFLEGSLPLNNFNDIKNDYVNELERQLTYARNEVVREEYEDKIKYDTRKAYCSYSSYCIEVPYSDLIEIAEDKLLVNLSELKDVDIQPYINISDAYYDTWVTESYRGEVVDELNRSLRRNIDHLVEEEDIDLEDLTRRRDDFYKMINKFNFNKFTEFYQSADGRIEFMLKNVDFKTNKIMFTYDGKKHQIPINEFINWIQGSVLDLNESIRMVLYKFINN